jgi:hypothetical protein
LVNTLVQLRLPENEVRQLKEAARGGGRTIQEEIRHRLFGDVVAPAGGTIDHAIGDLAAVVATRAREALVRQSHRDDRTKLLAAVRDTLAFVLNNLGAVKEATDNDFVIGIGWDLATRIKSAPRPVPPDDPEYVDTSWEDQIGDALGFRQSAVARARKGAKGK